MSTTIAYSHKDGYWKTKYSFFASFMKSVGRKFFSSPTSASVGETLTWRHNSKDDSRRTNFYDTPGGSGLSVVFNQNVTSNKIYKSFSIEGTNNISKSALNTFVVNSDNTPDKQFSLGPVRDKGGILYGHIGLSSTLLDGSNIKVIGTFDSFDFIIPPDELDGSSDFFDGYKIRGIINDPQSLADPGDFLINYRGYTSDRFRQTKSSVTKLSKYILITQDGTAYNLDGEEIVNFSSGVSYSDPSLGEPLELFIPPTDLDDSGLGYSYILFRSIFLDNYLQDMSDAEIIEEFDIIGLTDAYGNVNPLTGFSGSLPLEQQTITLLEITPQNINGAAPRGQYAQAEISLGSDPYELLALSVNYEPTNLDHSK